VYLIAAFAVTSKLRFDQSRAFVRGAAEASGGGFVSVSISPAWIIVTADSLAGRLWWLCGATGLGILLTALSALWVSLTSRGSTA
jgi:hypothetical protein